MELKPSKGITLGEAWWPILLLAGIAVNLLGLFIPIIEPDGALYATLAKTMVLSGDYIDLIYNGKDWLDKPHFPFWMIASGYQLFGVSTLGYKVPALLFWLMSLFYIYQFARIFYPKTVARLSVLIYITAMHGIISNTDVRAEPYLMGLVTGAVYHLFRVSRRLDWFDLVVGSLMAASAIMTKGIFLAIIIAGGLLLHGIIKRKWTIIFNIRWVLVLALVLIFISPELISLYKQFDLHPEKTVFGKQQVSGIRFFLWDSQFGRFFNTGPIKGEGDPYFFLHTTLWAFFPWSVVFFVAVFRSVITKFKEQKEFVCMGTVLITFLLFSFSKFQLPHYLNVIFPFMSILSAGYLFEISKKAITPWCTYLFNGQAVLAFILSVVLLVYFRPSAMVASSAWILGWVFVLMISTKRMNPFPASIARNVMGSLMVFGYIGLFMLPDMVRYQSGSQASAYFNDHTDLEPLMLDEDLSFSFDFYCPQEVKHISITELKNRGDSTYLFCHERLIPMLEKEGFIITKVESYPHYHITEPRWQFINNETRKSSLENYLIVKAI
jgi:4-amino-4-deoxy-L-arabinose transferase-like glycosyltransferase